MGPEDKASGPEKVSKGVLKINYVLVFRVTSRPLPYDAGSSFVPQKFAPQRSKFDEPPLFQKPINMSLAELH
jgi:hypothetical protein